MKTGPVPSLLPALGLLLALAPASAGAGERIIHKERSLYRNLVVWQKGGERCLGFSHWRQRRRQTCVDTRDPERLVFAYVRMMLAALLVNPEPKRLLLIGLGGGTLAGVLAKLYPELQQDLVEIDPAVVKVAREYFGFTPSPTAAIHEVDGRVFTRRAQRAGSRYDLIMLDAFNGDYIPEHLMTAEFLGEVKALLTPDGVLAANTFSTSDLYDHESVTYEAVFGAFLNFRLPGSGNRVILAAKRPLPDQETLAATAESLAERLAPYDVPLADYPPRLSAKRDWDTDARVLTDQYAPANLLRGPF